MIFIKESDDSCIYDKIINDESDEIYSEVSLSESSEDWMGLQLDYGKFNEDKIRFYGVGGIILKQTTPNTISVYVDRLDSSGEEDFLFFWNKNKDITNYNSDGDYEISAEFAWNLCHNIENKYF